MEDFKIIDGVKYCLSASSDALKKAIDDLAPNKKKATRILLRKK